MQIEKIVLGDHFPTILPVIIEMPMHHTPIKYEMDKASGALWVNRFMQTAMCYPCNYGFVPHTQGGDGDPMDVLVVTNHPIIPGAVIETRPIGALLLEDEAGMDEKIIALPLPKIDPELSAVENITDLDQQLKERIVHFFKHYKDLEANKWVKVEGFVGKEKAMALLTAAAKTYTA